MDSLDLLERTLSEWDEIVQGRVRLRREGPGLSLQRAAMQAFAEELPDGSIRVKYEYEPHELAVESVPTEVAAGF